ncbi:MAG: tetratricopeptide repeat protein, partial [Verrucomicrobiota bacterium]
SKSSDLKSAIYYQRQLIAAEDDETSPDEWLALIQRLEDDLRVNEADLTRRRLESKFGQDPEFLRQLGIHYLNAGDRTSARRVLEKIAALRPWDAETLLELGMLAVELGDEARAVQLFERILDETAESAPPADSKLEKLPFVAAHRERPKPGQSVGLGLETYSENVEDFDQLPQEWTEAIAVWLREAKPEFTRKPSFVEDLRLRAIEELARLVGDDEDWRQAWTDPESASPTERIWALAHSKGGNAGTQQLLDDHIRPRTGKNEQIGRWDFLYVLQTLRSGEIESLASWLDEQPAREATILLGVQILLRDRRYVFDEVRLRQALQLLDLTVDQVREQMHSIRLDQRLPEALVFGSILAETLELEDYRLSSDLASLCRQLGRTEQRQIWLESAFHLLTEPGAGFGYSFFDTISGLYQLQETAEGQQGIIDRVNNAIAHLPDWEDDKLEAPIWLAIASNQPELALEHVAKMATAQEEIRKSYHVFKYVRGPMTPDVELDLEIELWMRLESMLNLLAGRLPRSHFAELTDAIDSFELHEPEDEIAGSQFAEFKSLRLLWTLEAANPPQRARMIAEFLGEANSRDEYTELGRSLEARNLAPDAIPLYRFLIDANSADFSTVRSYLNCCRQGRSYDEALELLESYLHGRLQRPESMTEAYIHRNYSNMLFLAERVDKLAEICGTQSGAAFAEVIRDKQIRAFYQRHLISLYRKQENLDGAVAVFRGMKQNGSLTREDRLDWADVLEAKGDIQGAIKLLSQFSLKGYSSDEAQVVKRLGRLHAKSEEPDTNKLIELAKLSLTYRDSPTVARDMADHLIAVGRTAIADSILTRKARSEHTDGARFDLLLRQAKLRIGQGAKDSTKESVRQLLASWSGHLHDGEAFLEFVADTAAEERDFWREALDEVRDSGQPGL